MSQIDAGATHAAGHDEHHDANVAHHFDSAEQQYSSGKLGMWVFLATEILMFGGLFCGYAVWRANDPASFEYGHLLLDTKMGAINTVILIASSFTMAWGVRAAQLGQKQLLVVMLALTLAGACGFMVVKYFEYSGKMAHGIAPGSFFDEDQIQHHYGKDHDKHTGADAPAPQAEPEAQRSEAGGSGQAAVTTDDTADTTATDTAAQPIAGTTVDPPGNAPIGLAPQFIAAADHAEHAAHGTHAYPPPDKIIASQNFFDVYYMMTGLHGIHVLVGMGLIAWLLIRATRGVFGPQRFAAVDNVGLYWHLVDLIWIFLFPLLYLID